MKTIVDHKKFLELVGRLESERDAPAGLTRLVSLFKEMGLLMGGFGQSQDLEEKEAVWAEVISCQQRLQEEFAAICGQWGISPNEVSEYVENPLNYSLEEWRKVQEIKQEVHSAVEEGKADPSRKKRRQPRAWV